MDTVKIRHKSLHPDRQKLILKYIKNNKKYKVEPASGTIYSYRRNTNSWDELKGRPARNNMIGYDIFAGRGLSDFVYTYGHHIVWLWANGVWEQGLSLYHRDGNRMNNALSNLVLGGVEMEAQIYPRAYEPAQFVRHKKYKEIIKLLDLNPTITCKEISEVTRCSYAAVKYAVRKIKNGLFLKYSQPGPYPSSNSMQAKWLRNINDADYWIGPESPI